MGCPEWKNSIPALRPIRKTLLTFGGHVLFLPHALSQALFLAASFSQGLPLKLAFKLSRKLSLKLYNPLEHSIKLQREQD